MYVQMHTYRYLVEKGARICCRICLSTFDLFQVEKLQCLHFKVDSEEFLKHGASKRPEFMVGC